jgi:hypothetical protein
MKIEGTNAFNWLTFICLLLVERVRTLPQTSTPH